MGRQEGGPHHRVPFVAAILLIAVASGCDQLAKKDADREATDVPNPAVTKVIVQGQLQPSGGVLAVMAAPGDRVGKVLVSEGTKIRRGQILLELESLQAREIELSVAEIKLAEGKKMALAQKALAQAELEVANKKLLQAEAELERARDRLALAEQPGGSLDLLRQAAELAEDKLNRLRQASNDPGTRRLVSESTLNEEGLRVNEALAQYESQRAAAHDLIASSDLAVGVVEEEIKAAQQEIESTAAMAAVDSLERQVDLLRLRVETSRLISPIDGVVLECKAMVGGATTTMPLMHIADTSSMICEAEVNVADLPRIQMGQSATVSSAALKRDVSAKVDAIGRMIAPPNLANPFPMATVDRHSASVTLVIDAGDVEVAAALIGLQVEATIHVAASGDAT